MGFSGRDEWWDQLEVQMAERMSTGDPAEFLQCLINIVDSGIVKQLRAELETRGLTLEDLMDMRSQVKNAEGENADYENENAGNYNSVVLAGESRKAVKRLFLARFDEQQIADLLELEAARVGEYISRFGPNAQKIIQLHVRGESVNSISKTLGTSRHRVQEMISAFGQEPILERSRLTLEQRKQITALRKEGHGYTSIARQVGCDYYQVRHACRDAARARQNELARVDL